MSPDRQERRSFADSASPDVRGPLAQLERTLREQIQQARKGNIRGVESLLARTDQLLGELGSAPVARPAEMRRVLCLYNQLCLMLEAQKSELAQDLKQARKGRRMLNAYRDSLSRR